MPANKDFKRLVRARMRKTGEAYTTARVRLLEKKTQSATPPTPTATDYAARAGMSDAALKAKTGCTWEKWVRSLDRVGADRWSHRDIARYIHDTYKTSSWWSQNVTVGYERIKGLRDRGQLRDGAYRANKTRTFALTLTRLYRTISERVRGGSWPSGMACTIRTRVKDRSIRLTDPDGALVLFQFAGKGRGKSQVQVEHGNLPDRASAQRLKQFWGERLQSLAADLET